MANDACMCVCDNVRFAAVSIGCSLLLRQRIDVSVQKRCTQKGRDDSGRGSQIAQDSEQRNKTRKGQPSSSLSMATAIEMNDDDFFKGSAASEPIEFISKRWTLTGTIGEAPMADILCRPRRSCTTRHCQ